MSDEIKAWHFLDRRSKAIASNKGLKLEFATHQDASIGMHYLNAIEADRDAKGALLDDAVKALEAIDRMVGNPYIAVYDIVRDIRAETDAILTRLRDVPVHDTKGEA